MSISNFVKMKHIVPIALIVLISIYASHKLFGGVFYTSHDGPGHLVRIMEFSEAFDEGQIPVRIAKRIDNGLGYPFFNFNYPLVYYASKLLISVGLTSTMSFKVLMASTFFVSGLSMYILALRYFSTLGSFVAAMFYTIAPYKFLNVYVRGNIGESIGLAIAPLFLLSLDLIINKKKCGEPLFVVSASALILVHNITAMVVFVLGALFLVFTRKINVKLVKNLLPLTLLSLAMTSFFWFPALYESSLVILSVLTSQHDNFFPTFNEIIYSPWGFGLWKLGPFPGKMSPQLGLGHVFVVIVGMLMLGLNRFRGKFGNKDRIALFYLVIVVVSLFISVPLSKPLWDLLVPLQIIQMPWRFVGYATLGGSFLAGYVVSRHKKLSVVAILILLPLLLYANRNHVRVNQYTDFGSPYDEFGLHSHSTAAFHEHMPVGAPRVESTPNQNGDIFPPIGTSTRTVWKSNLKEYIVDVPEDVYFRSNTYFFPGWKAYIDGKEVKIEHELDELKRLYIAVPSGSHTVTFKFSEVHYRAASNIISILGLGGFIYFVYKKTKPMKMGTSKR